MFAPIEPRVPRDDWLNLFPSPYINEPKWTSIRAARRNGALLQKMSKLHSLEVHRGCVNTIWWDETGQYLLSGSDDHRLVISEPYSKKVPFEVVTSHKANIFSAKFLPCSNTRKIVSCAGDGNILYTDLLRKSETHNNNFTCHSGTTYELQTVQNDPNSFLSCGEDGTVRWFDLRTKDKCRKNDCKDDILIHIPYAVTSMTMNPFLPYYLAVGSSDSSVRIFDRRMLGSNPGRCKIGLVSKFLIPEMEGKKRRITAIEYRPDGQEILVSFSSDYIYVFDPNQDDLSRATKLCVGQRPTNAGAKPKTRERSPPPMKRLRLRGDWSDTGPNARPDNESQNEEPTSSSDDQNEPENQDLRQRRRQELNVNLMQRMTDALSRMLNDPSTRLAMRTLSERDRQQRASSEGSANEPQPSTSSPSGASWGTRPSSARWRDPDQPETGSNAIGELQDSISSMREEFIDRHNVEPGVNLRYGSQGTDSSAISMDPIPASNTSSAEDSGIRILPGPRQIVTDPGAPGTNPITGERQRRRGVSGPPSEPLAISTPQPSNNALNEEEDLENCFSDDDCCEYEYDPSEENETKDDSEKDEDDDKNEIPTRRFVKQPPSLQKFTGHRNARTMIKEATWWGNDFILSGSDCGHIFGWERNSGKLMLLLEADRHVVNCIQPHPYDPMIASSGIDYDIKIWTPSGSGNTETLFDEKRAEELTRMNEIMLEETRDTITVPATLMIRMLASLNQIRRAGRLIPRVLERRREREAEESSQNQGNVAPAASSANDQNDSEDLDTNPAQPRPQDDNDHETDEEGRL